MSYERQPFFLRGSQENVNRRLAQLGLRPDAPRSQIIDVLGHTQMYDVLFQNAGIDRDMDAANNVQYSDTMDSQRLAMYAASVDAEKGELMWRALSRRYFQGKDTQIRPIRLDSRRLLLECAAEVGLDLEKAERMLDSDVYRKEIVEMVEKMHSGGIHSIPVLCFEVDGVAEGSWLENSKSRGRLIHHGSGSSTEFHQILMQLHSQCTANM